MKLEFSDLERIDEAFVELWKVVNEYKKKMKECKNYKDYEMLTLLNVKIMEAENIVINEARKRHKKDYQGGLTESPVEGTEE